jgi:hypothetical protein
MNAETEYGFKLTITKGDTDKVQIDGYCSYIDKEALLGIALKTYDERSWVGLTLEEVEGIIKSNVTITDPNLYEAVYAVAVDIEHAVLEKNK